MLDFVKKKISENYYDKNFRGVDLEAKFEAYAEKLKKSRADRESLILIAAAVMELDDSHTVFHPPILKQRADYGWTMKIVGDSCFVTAVKPQSDAEKQGLKVGDIVLSINGVEPSRGNLWKVKYFYTRLNPQDEHVMQLTIQTPEGQPRSVSIAALLEKNSEGIGLREV
jgi:C-terminal processing protease CtpA/Prc